MKFSLEPTQIYDNITLEIAQEILTMTQKKEILGKYSWPTKPDKKGYYVINIQDRTSTSGRRKFSAKSIEDLREKVYQWEKNRLPSAKRTFEEVFEMVCTRKLDSAKGERLYSVQNTVKRDRGEYKRFFGGTRFAKLNIDLITDADIDTIIRDNLKRYDLRRKAFQSMLSILRNTFYLAYQRHFITENPFTYINPKDYSKMLAEDVDITERVHSSEDIEHILAFIREYQVKHPKNMGAYALELQIIIGARRGEIPPLMWSDVYSQYIRIHREQITVQTTGPVDSRFIIVNHTKNTQNRSVIRFEELDSFLAKLWRVHESLFPKSEFLFPADTPNGCINNYVAYRVYRRACNHLQIPICWDTKRGPHSFRRNAYTHYLKVSGGDYRGAQLIFGTTCARNYDVGEVDAESTSRLLNSRFEKTI